MSLLPRAFGLYRLNISGFQWEMSLKCLLFLTELLGLNDGNLARFFCGASSKKKIQLLPCHKGLPLVVAPLICQSGVTSDALADTAIKGLGGLASIKPQNFNLPREYVNHNLHILVYPENQLTC